MGLDPALERYLTDLDRQLAAAGVADRSDILDETRSHMAERRERMAPQEILLRLGPASALAAAYGDASQASAPAAVLRDERATQWSASVAMMGGVLLCVCAIVLATLCIAEIMEPQLVSVWLNAQSGNVFVGAANPDVFAQLSDLAGPWLLPSAAFLAGLAGVSGWAMVRLATLSLVAGRSTATPH